MLGRYAVITNGVVSNVIVWDGESEYPDSAELVDLSENPQVGPGWTYSGATFSAPEQVSTAVGTA
jgi:hypothetical protein